MATDETNMQKVNMSRYLLGLLVGLSIGGCAGKNTVAGEDKTRAEELESSLPTWCQSTCERIDGCAVAGCDCQGDVCNCSSGKPDCQADCERALGRFVNDACVDAGEAFKRCIDTMTCDDFNGNGKCEIAAEDKRRCPEVDDSGDEETPPVSVGGGPVSGGGGAGPGPDPGTGATGNTGGNGAGPDPGPGSGAAGSTGGAVTGTSVNCGSGYGTGGGAPAEPASSAVICEEGRGQCSDGHEYSWICARGSEGQLGCTCFVDSQVTGGFDPQSTSCPTQATVNAGCSWNIAY